MVFIATHTNFSKTVVGTPVSYGIVASDMIFSRTINNRKVLIVAHFSIDLYFVKILEKLLRCLFKNRTLTDQEIVCTNGVSNKCSFEPAIEPSIQGTTTMLSAKTGTLGYGMIGLSTNNYLFLEV